MKHVFDMKISQFMKTDEIYLDGKFVLYQSHLKRSLTNNFFDWYQKLPQLLYEEVHDKYDLKIECTEIPLLILKEVFKGKTECNHITLIPFHSKYSMSQRIGWANDVNKETGIFPKEIPKFSIKNTRGTEKIVSSIIKKMSPFYHKQWISTGGTVNIWIASVFTYRECLKKITSQKDLIIVVNEISNELKAQIESCTVLFVPESKIFDIVEQWIDFTILAPYLMKQYDGFDDYLRTQLDTFEGKAKLKMLFREEPVVVIRMPKVIDCGQWIEIDIKEFPRSALSLRISDHSVLKLQGTQLKAEKPGESTIDILSTEGVVLASQKITVLSVKWVKDIDLSLPDGYYVVIGDTFHVDAKWQPVDADNLNEAVWSSFPSGILRNIGGGQFEALAPGNCTITLTIGVVSRSIDVKVVSLANDIQMVSEIQARVNKTPVKFSASLLPVGSGCKSMDIRIIDQSIARWNPNTKEVIPVSEGTTELVVSVYDAKGKVVVQKKCKVDILPKRRTITRWIIG